MNPVNNDFIDKWLAKLVAAWTSGNVAAALALFDRCDAYYENPFSGNAATQAGGIARLWREIEDQQDIEIATRTLAASSGSAVVAYEASMIISQKHHRSSGIWHIVFNEGQCVEFHQWFMVDSASQD